MYFPRSGASEYQDIARIYRTRRREAVHVVRRPRWTCALHYRIPARHARSRGPTTSTPSARSIPSRCSPRRARWPTRCPRCSPSYERPSGTAAKATRARASRPRSTRATTPTPTATSSRSGPGKRRRHLPLRSGRRGYRVRDQHPEERPARPVVTQRSACSPPTSPHTAPPARVRLRGARSRRPVSQFEPVLPHGIGITWSRRHRNAIATPDRSADECKSAISKISHDI